MTTTAVAFTLTTVALLGLAAGRCAPRVVVAPIVVVPVTTWTIPLGIPDTARLCVATELGVVDPADVLPLRCVTIGTVRAWLRAQRMANE